MRKRISFTPEDAEFIERCLNALYPSREEAEKAEVLDGFDRAEKITDRLSTWLLTRPGGE